MGIPPDPYPNNQEGFLHAATTSFDRQQGGDNVRYAEIRGKKGENVVSVSITVIPPKGKPSIPLDCISFNVVNGSEPQIVAAIKTPDGSPIEDGYQCHFVFHSMTR